MTWPEAGCSPAVCLAVVAGVVVAALTPAALATLGRWLGLDDSSMPWCTRRRELAGKHVLITGGSEGIGLELGKQLASRSARVTLVARREGKLKDAAAAIQQQSPESVGHLHIQPADTTNFEQIQGAVRAAEASQGPVDILVCNAGTSTPGRFLEQDVSVFESAMKVNYLGTVCTLKAAVPQMVARGSGVIVIIASAAAVCGFAGFSTYAPTKWALRGLADCLRNELLASGVSVSIAYPPDTDTPGYKEENRTKPQECHAASRMAGDILYTPAQVAKGIVRGIERGAYHIASPDFGQNMMITSSASLTPRLYPVILECLMAPVAVLALRIYGALVDRVVVRASGKCT